MRQFTDLLPAINIESGQHWWVGYSGGLDSTVLLHLLASANLSVKISAIHVNHQISANANLWQQCCEEFCRRLNIDCVSEKVIVENRGKGIEDAARSARYAVFEKYLKPDDVLFTGHHADDQAETLLLRLLRGAGIKGLSGISAKRRFGNATICRPLLAMTRDELLAYAQQHQLQWIEDESNFSEAYDRNYLRLKVMPLLQSRWPGMQKKWSQATSLCSETDLLLTEIAREDLSRLDNRNERVGKSINLKKFKSLSVPRQHNVIRYWLEINGYSTPEQQHWQQVDEQFASNETDVKIDVHWGNVSLRLFQLKIFLLPVVLPQLSLIMKEVEQSKTENLLKKDLPNIHLRSRVGGERCRPANRTHSQTLKKCLQEFALEPWLRDQVPLVYSNDNLVAVGDLWVCADYLALPNETGLKLVWS